MTVSLITTIQNFIGLSTDTKPTGVPPGSTFWEYDTNVLFKTYDGTNWTTVSVGSFTAAGTINLQQAAGPYDLFTATGGNVLIEKFTITLPNVDCSDDVNLTSIKVESNTTAVVTLLSATAGAKANLTANASFSYSVPFTLPATKKLILTIAGGAADASTLCTTSVKYQSIAPAGYLA